MIKDEMIVKSNKLIEARMNFTSNEYKLITYLLGKIKKNDREFRTFDIDIKELNKYCFNGITGTKTYNYIKHKYAETLSKKDIKIKGDNGIKIYNWFSIVDTDKRGIFSLCFNAELKDFLLEEDAKYKEKGNEGYTKYKLSNILNFKNFYSMRIYELTKQYEKLGKRTILLDKLRYILGIEDNQYTIYRDFRKRILNPAVESINENTDIKVTFDEDKLGRNVEGINFYIISQRTIHEPIELIEIKERIENVVNAEVKTKFLEEKFKEGNLKKEDIYYYLDNWSRFDYKKIANPVGFVLHCAENKIPLPQTREGIRLSMKPEQATNFEQRKYDDEFFENLYDNF